MELEEPKIELGNAGKGRRKAHHFKQDSQGEGKIWSKTWTKKGRELYGYVRKKVPGRRNSINPEAVLHEELRMSPNVLEGKQSACNAGDPGLLPGSGRSPEKGSGYSLQYSCLGNLIDRGAWWATVHGVTRVGQEWAHFHLFHLRRWVCLEQREWGGNNRRETRVHHTYSVHRFKIFISCDSLGSFYAAWLGLDLELNGELMAVVISAFPLFMNCDQQPETTLSVNLIKPLPCTGFCYGMVSVRKSQLPLIGYKGFKNCS